MTMKMQETKTWLEIQWKSLKAHSRAISATTIAEMAFQAQWSLNFFFLSDRSDRNNDRKPGFSQFELEFASHEILFILDSMPLSK